MAFCGKCGAHVDAGERFCVNCGHDLTAAAAAPGTPAVPAAPVAAAPQAPPPPPHPAPVAAPPVAYPQAMPPSASYPPYYPMPGQMPIVTMPQPVPSHHGWIWGVVVVVGIVAGLYYIGKNDQNRTQPRQNPVQPNTGQQTQGGNAALLEQQLFTSQWRVSDGQVQLYNQVWKNQSDVAIKTASAECDQVDQNGSVLAKKNIVLRDETDPVLPAGYSEEFNDLNIGQAVQGLTGVNCGMISVTPAQ